MLLFAVNSGFYDNSALKDLGTLLEFRLPIVSRGILQLSPRSQLYIKPMFELSHTTG